MHRVLVVFGLSLLMLFACAEKKPSFCIGKLSCEGEWKVFAGQVGAGQSCTMASGDLHVRYETKSSDELVALWSKLIPEKMGLKMKGEWGAGREYRQAWYVGEKGGRLLNVSVVPTLSTKIRTLRMTWE